MKRKNSLCSTEDKYGLGRGCGHLAWLVLGRHAWASGSADPEKVPAFFDFAGTFFCSRLIETHSGSFYCTIWLDAGTFVNKILYRPANKLTDMAHLMCVSREPVLVPTTTSLLHKIFFD